jgi:hypothetical protein
LLILELLLFKICINLSLGSDFKNSKGGKVILWNQVKSRMEACYSELILACTPWKKTPSVYAKNAKLKLVALSYLNQN